MFVRALNDKLTNGSDDAILIDKKGGTPLADGGAADDVSKATLSGICDGQA